MTCAMQVARMEAMQVRQAEQRLIVMNATESLARKLAQAQAELASVKAAAKQHQVRTAQLQCHIHVQLC